MPTLHLILSHSLTPEQKADARQNWGIDQFQVLPPDLQALWSNVPPTLEELTPYFAPLLEWISEHLTWKDYLLVQGDFGAVFLVVEYCRAFNYGTPLYATTLRQTQESLNEDGSVRIERVFKHVRYREYGI